MQTYIYICTYSISTYVYICPPIVLDAATCTCIRQYTHPYTYRCTSMKATDAQSTYIQSWKNIPLRVFMFYIIAPHTSLFFCFCNDRSQS